MRRKSNQPTVASGRVVEGVSLWLSLAKGQSFDLKIFLKQGKAQKIIGTIVGDESGIIFKRSNAKKVSSRPITWETLSRIMSVGMW